MGKAISIGAGIEIGVPFRGDESEARQRAQRFQNLLSDAWNAVCIAGSEELKQHRGTPVGVYWEFEEAGEVGPDGLRKADAQAAITKRPDERRLENFSCTYIGYADMSELLFCYRSHILMDCMLA